MNISIPNFSIDTYSRVLISVHGTLNSIINQRITTIRQQLQQGDTTDSIQPKLLHAHQLNCALYGPFANFFNQFLTGYSTVVNLQQQIIQRNESIFSDAPPQHDSANIISNKDLKKISPSEIERIDGELSQFMQEVNSQWSEQVEKWIQTYLDHFKSIDLKLEQSDLSDFQNLYPITELLNRVGDLGIAPLKLNNQEHYTFSNYFKLKCKLAVYNHLSKQHKPNTEKEVELYLKKFEPVYKSTNEQEQARSAQHQEKIDSLLEELAFAKIKPS